MAGTGANGTAEKVESRDKVNAHKRCRSGVPGAHIFATSIRFEGGEDGPEVLHFVVLKSAEGLSVGDNWNTIGMRGTGSHDVFLKDVFVPDASIAARRPADQWHKIWSVVRPHCHSSCRHTLASPAEAAAAKKKGDNAAGALGALESSPSFRTVMAA